MLFPSGAAAQASIITPDGGQAAWFFGTCVDEDATNIVRWDLRPDLSYPEGNTLQLRVKNGYPGHRLSCKLYLANTGDIPLLVNDIRVGAVASGILVEAYLPPEEQGKIIGPCMKPYAWSTPLE
ncbi:MAG: hypothetical protein D6784_18240, partial [Chloroflexi bacterium]